MNSTKLKLQRALRAAPSNHLTQACDSIIELLKARQAAANSPTNENIASVISAEEVAAHALEVALR